MVKEVTSAFDPPTDNPPTKAVFMIRSKIEKNIDRLLTTFNKKVLIDVRQKSLLGYDDG
jgi:hypothetical protein